MHACYLAGGCKHFHYMACTHAQTFRMSLSCTMDSEHAAEFAKFDELGLLGTLYRGKKGACMSMSVIIIHRHTHRYIYMYHGRTMEWENGLGAVEQGVGLEVGFNRNRHCMVAAP